MKYLYLLDANVFIEAKNRYYGFNLCPGFWEWLITPNNVMVRVASIDKVKEEILEKEDELADWAKNLDENFFLKSDDDDDLYVRSSLKEVSEWIDERYDLRLVKLFSSVLIIIWSAILSLMATPSLLMKGVEVKKSRFRTCATV